MKPCVQSDGNVSVATVASSTRLPPEENESNRPFTSDNPRAKQHRKTIKLRRVAWSRGESFRSNERGSLFLLSVAECVHACMTSVALMCLMVIMFSAHGTARPAGLHIASHRPTTHCLCSDASMHLSHMLCTFMLDYDRELLAASVTDVRVMANKCRAR
jgi:hypothetical protein